MVEEFDLMPPPKDNNKQLIFGIKQSKEILMAVHRMQCQGCFGIYTAKELTVDHVMPSSDGGTDHISNLTLLCTPCNSRKNNLLTLSGLRDLNQREGLIAGKWASFSYHEPPLWAVPLTNLKLYIKQEHAKDKLSYLGDQDMEVKCKGFEDKKVKSADALIEYIADCNRGANYKVVYLIEGSVQMGSKSWLVCRHTKTFSPYDAIDPMIEKFYREACLDINNHMTKQCNWPAWFKIKANAWLAQLKRHGDYMGCDISANEIIGDLNKICRQHFNRLLNKHIDGNDIKEAMDRVHWNTVHYSYYTSHSYIDRGGKF